MLAVLADDYRKAELVDLLRSWSSDLGDVTLLATRDTGNLIRSRLELDVALVESGSRGGALQIAALVVEGVVSAVVALQQPSLMPDGNVGTMALRQICDVHDVSFASNLATADAAIAAIVLHATGPQEPGGAVDWFKSDRERGGATINSVSRDE